MSDRMFSVGRPWMRVRLAAAASVLFLAVACGGDDTDQRINELEDDVRDLEAEADAQSSDELNDFLDCYHDPDTPEGPMGLPDCDPPATTGG